MRKFWNIVIIMLLSFISCVPKKDGLPRKAVEFAEYPAVEDLGVDIKEYLKEIFPGEAYTIFERPLQAGERRIWFAAHYIHDEPKIFNKAVGFEVVQNEIHRYLLVENFVFLHKDNTIYIDFSPQKYPGIYGFDFRLSNGGDGFITVDGYFDEGNRPADSFFIEWDEEKRQFRDRSPF